MLGLCFLCPRSIHCSKDSEKPVITKVYTNHLPTISNISTLYHLRDYILMPYICGVCCETHASEKALAKASYLGQFPRSLLSVQMYAEVEKLLLGNN